MESFGFLLLDIRKVRRCTFRCLDYETGGLSWQKNYQKEVK